MPTVVPVACSEPRCPGFAVHRGKCERHRQTTTERGYGRTHQQARESLGRTLPTPCGYCRVVVWRGELWVAAHRIDGDPTAGWMVAHPTCNERGKMR